MRSKPRELYVLWPDKTKAFERLANKVAPLTVHKRIDNKGARTVGVCGKYIIVRSGATGPTRGMKVAASFDGGGSTTNMDWFEAVELAQLTAVKAHTRYTKALEDAERFRQNGARRKKDKKARSQRKRTARKQRHG